MTDHTDDDLEQLTDAVAWLAAHVDEVPRHRRFQALRLIERVERLIPDTAEGTE